ncbi:50S ribosomal protein L16 [Candidatus Woesearchaeota archaeon CG11_big_fil_rev_8_21_14_0_20_43_8]|nr:MAG: 50S ribosomal protein L16 [Candidatus Woesearchaeota archaeon CG11_big_fil_rev_8_21_14_0_20_43_8]PIO04848.1 MAG: 50S ribosomal protein L16 [Candidatus Woesearchaeota archaeon CG08_land_8_20_14_0_20_43_7]
MARLRKFCCYRRLERPYTRISKFREKSYIRTNPNIKLVRFDMGDTSKQYMYKVQLCAKTGVQIRHQALESARQTANRVLEKEWGKTGYRFTIKVYPHHILRENPIASGAGADRMSTGMQLSFGKPIGSAAQLKPGKVIMEVQVPSEIALAIARKAMVRANNKMPCGCNILVVKNDKVAA